jgi:hypothetical protein
VKKEGTGEMVAKALTPAAEAVEKHGNHPPDFQTWTAAAITQLDESLAKLVAGADQGE